MQRFWNVDNVLRWLQGFSLVVGVSRGVHRFREGYMSFERLRGFRVNFEGFESVARTFEGYVGFDKVT